MESAGSAIVWGSCGVAGAAARSSVKLQVVDSASGPPETRTPDPLIKSQLLYQLS